MVFHWPLPELQAMPLEELTMWRDLAVERWNRVHEVKGQ